MQLGRFSHQLMCTRHLFCFCWYTQVESFSMDRSSLYHVCSQSHRNHRLLDRESTMIDHWSVAVLKRTYSISTSNLAPNEWCFNRCAFSCSNLSSLTAAADARFLYVSDVFFPSMLPSHIRGYWLDYN